MSLPALTRCGSLPVKLRARDIINDQFKKKVKTVLFARDWRDHSADATYESLLPAMRRREDGDWLIHCAISFMSLCIRRYSGAGGLRSEPYWS